LMLMFAMIAVMTKLEKRYRQFKVNLPKNLSTAQRIMRDRIPNAR
jgi:hypothetical protein